jgi:hypothetical protein
MAVELYVRYKKRTTHSLNFEEAKAIVRCGSPGVPTLSARSVNLHYASSPNSFLVRQKMYFTFNDFATFYVNAMVHCKL